MQGSNNLIMSHSSPGDGVLHSFPPSSLPPQLSDDPTLTLTSLSYAIHHLSALLLITSPPDLSPLSSSSHSSPSSLPSTPLPYLFPPFIHQTLTNALTNVLLSSYRIATSPLSLLTHPSSLPATLTPPSSSSSPLPSPSLSTVLPFPSLPPLPV